MATILRVLLACVVPIVASLILPMTASNGDPDVVSILNHVTLMEQEMKALQQQVQTSNIIINSLTTALKSANEKISEVEKQVAVLSHDQGVEVVPKNSSSSGTYECKMEIETLRASAEANFTRLQDLILDKPSMLANTSGDVAVAFQTILQQSITVDHMEYLKFDSIVINHGGAYSNSTGVFTVPTSGVYMFWAHIVSTVASPFSVALVKNGHGLVGGSTGTRQDSATASFVYIAEFQEGELVAFQNYHDGNKTALEGWGFSSYGGVFVGK